MYMYQRMSACKSITVEELTETLYEVECDIPLTYTFEYCVSYRDPALWEWILDRWIWNDQWVWDADWVWND